MSAGRDRTILITEAEGFSRRAIGILRESGFTVVEYRGPLADLAEALPGREGVIVRLGVHWDGTLFEKAPHLAFIASPTTGLDHIDLDAARGAGIEVISLRGLPGLERITSTAEHTLGLLLCLLRRTGPAHRSVLEGRWDRDSFKGREARGMALGIVGLGRLGKMFADMAAALGMSVIFYDPHVDDTSLERASSLEALAARADVVSLHVTLEPGTEGMIGPSFFASSRKGQYLLNTSRGALVDEEALIAALDDGTLAGAALDVLCREPEKGGGFGSPVIDYARTHDNVIITPHIGGATLDAMQATEAMIAREIAGRYGPAGPR